MPHAVYQRLGRRTRLHGVQVADRLAPGRHDATPSRRERPVIPPVCFARRLRLTGAVAVAVPNVARRIAPLRLAGKAGCRRTNYGRRRPFGYGFQSRSRIEIA
jgi:hypothetical protein